MAGYQNIWNMELHFSQLRSKYGRPNDILTVLVDFFF